MKKYILGLLVLLIPSIAHAEEGKFPGSAWVNVTGPHVGGEEDGNWILSSKAIQEVVVSDINTWKLSAYTSVSFSIDTMGYEWNNKVTPAIGLQISKEIGPGILTVGVQQTRETHFGKLYKSSPRSTSGTQVLINYWIGWGR